MDNGTIRARIEKVLSDEFDETARHDIAFHMMDWLNELRALVRFYEAPNDATDEEVSSALMDFLIHAPEHIAAASKLYIGKGIEDIFGVGAVDRP